MKESLLYNTDALILVIVLFLLMIGMTFVGKWFGKRNASQETSSTLVNSTFGLTAFLLAFTYSMSSNRFDARRTATVKEANSIGTAILLCDLYSDSQRLQFRNDFKNYLEARIDYFEARRNKKAITAAMHQADISGKQIWRLAAQLSKDPSRQIPSRLLIPRLNDMFDDATSLHISLLSSVPDTILVMLFILSLASSFYAGYTVGNKKTDWLITVGFCFFTALVIYITLDLDRPSRGLIQLDTGHLAMYELRNLLKD